MPRTLSLALITVLPIALASCTPQARYPAIEGDVATESLNVLPSPLVMRLALQRVASRHMPGVDAYDILLPKGVTDEVASDIARKLGENVYVTRTLKQDAPVLVVRRVFVLGDTATVDVERPVDAADARQILTVRLRSDIRGWRVIGVRSWPVGLRFTPQTADPFILEDAQPAGDDAPELEMDTHPIEGEDDAG